jgi:alanine dehydrogenase
MKIAIIREEKNPPDSRVPLAPFQVAELIKKGYQIEVQRSKNRCFKDEEYEKLGIPMIDNITDHGFLLGVKEVPVDNILAGKTYFMFSHTIKEQPYNAKLIKRIISQESTLVDYEVLVDENDKRVIAFGKFAGMVGAHNALYTFGKQCGKFELPRMTNLDDYKAAKEVYSKTNFPKVKIALTGTGRVSNGAALVLEDMGIKKVTPLSFVKESHNEPVYTQLSSFFYAKRKDGKVFENILNFYNHPNQYESDFHHFLGCTDIFINGIYWHPEAPAFFTKEQMRDKDFSIKVIADVTCDIAPEASVPSTLRPSTIADPVYGYDINSEKEIPAYTGGIDVMAIDNLPNELPKDASVAFGEMFMTKVLSPLEQGDDSIIKRGTIVNKGKLTERFSYLKDYAGV